MNDPDWINDYHALVEGRGCVQLDGWSSLDATGADAGALLNNFCTNDILKLEVGEACEAFFPNAKGKVLAFGWVWRTDDAEFRIVLGSDRVGTLVAHLDRYIIREDVKFFTDTGHIAISLGDHVAERMTTLHSLGDTARLLVCPSCELLASNEALNAYRIEHGVPLDGADVDDRNLPQELGRDTMAISFTKGCYLGQETVARIDALGHVNQQLVLLRLEGDAAPGDELRVDNKTVGRLTSVSWSPKHESVIALGYVRRGHAGSQLVTASGVSVTKL